MKEIKFRIWVKCEMEHYQIKSLRKNSELIPGHSLPSGKIETVKKIAWVRNNVFITTDSVSKPLSEVILMQYTGLKDRNGKEIYEGDIVKWRDETRTDCTVNIHSIGEVIWLECSYIIKMIKEGELSDGSYSSTNGYYDYDGACFNWNELEVIGNIYENKELLA